MKLPNATQIVWMLLIGHLATSGMVAADAPSATIEITYVASEGVYLDGGRKIGLQPGDTLKVQRKSKSIGLIVVTHAASNSAAATVIESRSQILKGDRALLPVWVQARASLDSVAHATAAIPEPARIASQTRRTERSNVHGDISFQVYGRQDLTGSDASWIQPGIRSRIEVQQFAGLPASLLIRHRSRGYYRSSRLSASSASDDWSHRVFEFGLTSSGQNQGAQWGVGRVMVRDVRGMGYIDGGYYTHHWNSQLRSGVAFGSTPNSQTSGFAFGRKKFGIFTAYEWSRPTVQRLVLSGALSTEYDGSTVSRDFLYLQATYSRGSALSLYQSMDLDFNRDWRYERSGNRMELSNLYSMLTANISPRLGLNLSYDSRRSFRYFETRNVPDSLFDNTAHRGWRAGLRITPVSRVYLRVNGGIRLHESDSVESRFVTFSARLTRFPTIRRSVLLNLSIVEAGLTTGYRPMVSYRFPLSRSFYMNVSAASHIYKSATLTTSNFYVEASSSKALGSKYYLSGSLRRYFDDQLKSFEFYTDLSVRL